MRRWIFECKVCGGTGRVENRDFERCKRDKNYEDFVSDPGNCLCCDIKLHCWNGEFLPCWKCDNGRLVVEEKYFKLVREEEV